MKPESPLRQTLPVAAFLVLIAGCAGGGSPPLTSEPGPAPAPRESGAPPDKAAQSPPSSTTAPAAREASAPAAREGGAAPADEENGQGTDAQALIARSEDEYARGVEAYRSEDVEEAMRLFDSAVQRLLQAPAEVREQPAVSAALQELVDNIHALEVDAYEERGRHEATPVEELKKIEAFLTPEDAERQRRQVEEELPKVEADLPIVVNEQVLALIEAYQTTFREPYQAGMRRSGRYLAMMRRVFEEEGLPQDLAYMAQVESTFKVTAYSRARARGLWQFIASTGRMYGLRSSHWVDERSDPEKATRAAARHLRDLYRNLGDWYLAMAAYNAGEGKISRVMRTLKTRDFWRMNKSRLLRRETRNYVPAILASILIFKDPKRYGFEVEVDPELRYETAEVDSATEFKVIAQCAGVSVDEVAALNPELRRQITPPDEPTYTVKLPVGTSERFAQAFAQVPREQRLTYTEHRVRQGETLATIVSVIESANGVRNRHRISVGQVLTIPVGAAGEVYSAPRDDDGEARGGHERGERIVHRVRRGETLYRIARLYRTTVDSIRRWNSLGSSSLLRPGRRLVVYYRTRYGQERMETVHPSNGGAPPPVGDGGAILHQVRRGETLYAIARRYQITVESLCELNNLSISDVLRPGTLLSISAR
jgi:membrane-bound lytic murein transglycosylase D